MLTLVESDAPDMPAEVRRVNVPVPVIGVTGSPGSGKSTLVDALIAEARARKLRVAVVAVDPSSPFSGGAILGDRIRMLRHHADPGVFVRSVASRGALGGLSRRAMGVVSVMEAFGFDLVFVETVGVGQSEVDIARVADHTVLVLTPGGGDGVQAFKAGIMEIADLLVVNKADLPGADTLVRELRAAQSLAPHDEHTLFAEILKTVAAKQEGVAELLNGIFRHRERLGEAGVLRRRLERARFEVGAEIQDRARGVLLRAEPPELREVAEGRRTAADLADELLRRL